MERTTLGGSGIEVSAWCLGTMTWGRQTAQKDAHNQIDRALDAGIDFLDTAEMYPVNPVKPETVGDTERVIGDWIEKTNRRNDLVIATKMSGPSDNVRDNAPITAATLREALDQSLKRLKTDVIDLYQLHWPNRGSYHFRQIWDYDPTGRDTDEIRDNIADVMEALVEAKKHGKIKAFGLSNDSAWGTMQWLRAADRAGGPRVVTMQNEYSLLCRQYDSDLAELSVHEDVTLLAFSPLAAGYLTGKYQRGAVPDGSRKSLNPNMGGRASDRVEAAVAAYLDIAARHGLDPVHMALAWTRARPFPTIPIFGATDMDQLETALGGTDTRLSDEVLAEISTAHRTHPMPY